VQKHFTICIHKSLQSEHLTTSSMFTKITKYKSIDFRNIYILHQTHTTKKTYNQWVSSRMVHTYTSSTSCGTCCNSTNPKYNVVTWCKNMFTLKIKKLTCISIRKWVGFSSKTFGLFNFQATFLLLGLTWIFETDHAIIVAFVSSNN
jgi:hypothetical protein